MADWSNLLGQCLEKVSQKWPEPPKHHRSQDSPATGFLYSGNIHETVPKALLMDKRLTPLERNAWQVFKLLLDKEGFAVPRYQDLQPYLSMVPYGDRASKETVARVLSILRLTRWLSLVTRGRDAKTGRIQGVLYILHDEPVSLAEAIQIDVNYAEFALKCTQHANKSVRLVASGTMTDLRDGADTLPSRLEVLGNRISQRIMSSESEPGQKDLIQLQNPPGSESEPGQNHRVRNRALPGSDSEPGTEPAKIHAVRNPNQVDAVRTVLNTNTCTVRTVPDKPAQLHWPPPLKLSPPDQAKAISALQTLVPEVQQQVLDEAAKRIASGTIRNPAGYLFGLIRKACNGDFKPWAAHQMQLPMEPPEAVPRPQYWTAQQQSPHARGPQPVSDLAAECMRKMKEMAHIS